MLLKIFSWFAQAFKDNHLFLEKCILVSCSLYASKKVILFNLSYFPEHFFASRTKQAIFHMTTPIKGHAMALQYLQSYPKLKKLAF
jgi:hypothetical protein